jgi:hypothetical protein
MQKCGLTVRMSAIGLLLVSGVLGAALTGCATVSSSSNDIKGEVVAPAPDAGFITEPGRQAKAA